MPDVCESKVRARGGCSSSNLGMCPTPVVVLQIGSLPTLEEATTTVAELGVPLAGMDSAKWQDKVLWCL